MTTARETRSMTSVPSPTVHIGTSGFASPSARANGTGVSASATDLLARYALRHTAVEMDSSFYRPPSPDTVRGWCDNTHDDFTFTVRVPRQVTHVDRLATPQRISGFCGSLAPLGPRLGCLLFATPPTLECDVERLRATLDAVNDRVSTAWEFRHPSWMCRQTLDLLVTRRSAPVIVETLDGISGKDLLPGGPTWDETPLPFLYVRLRKDRYRPGDLVAWGELLAEAVSRGRSVYVFFRQSPEASAYTVALGEVIAERLSYNDSAPRQPVNTDTRASSTTR